MYSEHKKVSFEILVYYSRTRGYAQWRSNGGCTRPRTEGLGGASAHFIQSFKNAFV